MSPDEAEEASINPEDDGETRGIIHDFIKRDVAARHNGQLDEQKFEPGDTVRVRLEQRPNEKRVEPWSRQTYLVIAAIKPRAEHRSWQYELLDLSGRFYNGDLQLVKEVQNPIKLPETYIISKLVRPAVQKGIPGYVVRWRGYKASDDTFEPREALLVDVPKEVHKFEKEHNVVWKKTAKTWRYTWDE